MVDLVGQGDPSPNRNTEQEGASWEEKQRRVGGLGRDVQEEGPSLSEEATVPLL